ncbi:MAG: sodium/proline symporter [Steroidobacteraceae bacterium]
MPLGYVMILLSFCFCLLLFLLIGIYSATRSRGTAADYYLASSSVSPWMVGLSAVATNNSGYMFIGVIGYTYTTGLASVWLMVGWILGDLLASLWVHRHLRLATAATGELSFSGVISAWTGQRQPYVRVLGAVFSIVFLGAYAAAQFSAGGKALHALFGWNLHSGAMLVAVVVAIYCIAGGIRASIWTDVAQSAVMLAAMALLMVTAINGLGGIAASLSRLQQIPGQMDWFPRDLLLPGIGGMMLFVIGWLFAGLSVAGQPHIMIRFMALDKPAHLTNARWWYYSFFVMFYVMATVVGLLSRVYLPELVSLDPELALPTMAQSLLPPVLVGFMLAGIFAATMSTADSLVLSCSACLTNDLLPSLGNKRYLTKAATLLVTAMALAIAVTGPESVFQLVLMAWSILGAVFVPVLLVLAIGEKPTQSITMITMLTGATVSLLWRYMGLHDYVFEGMPGMLAALIVFTSHRCWVRSAHRATRAREPNLSQETQD